MFTPRCLAIRLGVAWFRWRSLLLTTALALLVGSCDIDPLDFDNLSARATVSFDTDGQHYVREWALVLHREGAFSIDAGEANLWRMSQSGILFAGPHGINFLLRASVTGQTLEAVARGQIAKTNVSVELADNPNRPRSLADLCPGGFPSTGCTAAMALTLDPDQRPWNGPKKFFQIFVGSYYIVSETSGQRFELNEKGTTWVAATYTACSAERWRDSGIIPSDISAVERPGGDAFGKLGFEAGRHLASVCLSSSDHTDLEYVGNGTWRVPAAPIRPHTFYRVADVPDPNASVRAVILSPSRTLDAGKLCYSPTFFDAASGDLIFVRNTFLDVL